MSLDALRGADMLCIMGGSSLVMALCALFGRVLAKGLGLLGIEMPERM